MLNKFKKYSLLCSKNSYLLKFMAFLNILEKIYSIECFVLEISLASLRVYKYFYLGILLVIGEDIGGECLKNRKNLEVRHARKTEQLRSDQKMTILY